MCVKCQCTLQSKISFSLESEGLATMPDKETRLLVDAREVLKAEECPDNILSETIANTRQLPQ